MGYGASELRAAIDSALESRAIYRTYGEEPFTDGIRTEWRMEYVPVRTVRSEMPVVAASDLVGRLVV